LKDVLTTIPLAESLCDEPVLISGLVRIAIVELAMQPIWQGLAERKWNVGHYFYSGDLWRFQGVKLGVKSACEVGMMGGRSSPGIGPEPERPVI
jgi:hypothetical protein